MNEYTNKNYFLASMVLGLVFIAFSVMLSSWMLAITTLIFIALQLLLKKTVEINEEQKAREAIENLSIEEKAEDPLKVKFPIDLVVLLIFLAVFMLELLIVLISTF